MKISATKLLGVSVIEVPIFSDERGTFTKIFHDETFRTAGIDFRVKESFYSVSHKNVIRGMHFQIPPEDHSKLVYCPSGAIIDVVLDIRKESPTFGSYISVELNPENGRVIYIPAGCAHGFLSLKDNSVTVYFQSTVRSAEHERGIRYDSFGMEWDVSNPITSLRDNEFPALADLVTPFTYPVI